ncbi:uncharacterized protein LOC131427863 [Malaya genurostris]|uniref:uncharacterized protein LOC131427863 n=1 Tax=Malaya genurostris TaxID=325434 RepID=UPI0026F3ACFA|nr:uncharacterized protein LOC131427863 [Malaya genurostris]
MKICSLEEIEINLAESDECITKILYKSLRGSCEARTMKLNHTMWFESAHTNEWIYSAPTKEKITIINNDVTTTKEIIGIGAIKLNQGMTLVTDEVKIGNSQGRNRNKTIYLENITDVTPESLINWKHKIIPVINKDNKIFTFIDNKRLFDLGIDVKRIIEHRTLLENVIYAPLEQPWITMSTVIIICGIVTTICAFCHKGKFSCCTKTKIVHNGNSGSSNDMTHTNKKNVKEEQTQETINIPCITNTERNTVETMVVGTVTAETHAHEIDGQSNKDANILENPDTQPSKPKTKNKSTRNIVVI